jgi:hypothetical protein
MHVMGEAIYILSIPIDPLKSGMNSKQSLLDLHSILRESIVKGDPRGWETNKFNPEILTYGGHHGAML